MGTLSVLDLLVGAGAIIHILLPNIAPGEKVGDHKTMAACVEWLGKLRGETTWEDEMDEILKDHCATIMSTSTRLF